MGLLREAMEQKRREREAGAKPPLASAKPLAVAPPPEPARESAPATAPKRTGSLFVKHSPSERGTVPPTPPVTPKLTPAVAPPVAPPITPAQIEAQTLPDEPYANLPEEQRVNVQDLRANIDYLINNLENKDAIGGVLRNIIKKLQSNPELCVFVPNQDINLIVTGLRSAYKFAQREAQGKRAVRAKKEEATSELDAMFSDMNFGSFS